MKLPIYFFGFSKQHRCLSNYSQFTYFNFYEKLTGKKLSQIEKEKIIKKNPKIETVTKAKVTSILQILKKFNILQEEVALHPHLFTMNPITVDNYASVLSECGFTQIKPIHVMRYHTIVRSHSVAQLKKKGCLQYETKLVEKLLKCFDSWPETHPIEITEKEGNILSILKTRMKILEKYLNWRLGVTQEEFLKYCRNYLVIKHRPFQDIHEAIQIAETELKFSAEIIRRHGFLISADPTNTKMLLENVPDIAGVELRKILRITPAIIKNNYESINRIRAILEEFRIPNDAIKRSLRVFCMCPESVYERLSELSAMSEFQALNGNPRVLNLVVHKNKMTRRLARLKASNKRCFSLDSLITSKKVFDSFANRFGDKLGGRDLALMVYREFNEEVEKNVDPTVQLNLKSRRTTQSGDSIVSIAEPIVTLGLRAVTALMRRHNYWRNATSTNVARNIETLKQTFCDEAIYNNCHLLVYPTKDIIQIVDELRELRKSWQCGTKPSWEAIPNAIDYGALTDAHLLALTLYAIEKQHHFSGDGIWGGVEKKQASSVGST